MIERFENTSIVIRNNNAFASRLQVQELYGVAKSSLSEHLSNLKNDGLITGRKTRTVAKDGKMRELEMFDLNEIIAIGFRLRSEKAIEFQRWASNVISNVMLNMQSKIDEQQAQLDYFWDKEDQKDLYRTE